MKFLFNNFTFVLSMLIIGLVGAVILAFMKSLVFFAAIIIPIFSIFRLIDIYNASQQKIDFMFNAIDCDDYAFSFPELNGSIKERSLNALLNRIKEILTNAKIRSEQREKYYEHIVNSIDSGIIILNDDGNVYQTNVAMHKMLDLEVIGHINHISNISTDLADKIQLSRPNMPLQATCHNDRGDSTYSILASYIDLEDKRLKIVVINNLNSVLESKELEAWSKLSRILTHEIMNSLAPITSLSETLITMNRDPEMQQGLATICQTNRSLISFVENYRSFTRTKQPEKSPFEVKPLIENLATLICPEDVNLTLTFDPEDTMLYADENMILQVIVNVLKNAVQAIESQAEKRIDIKTYIQEDENIVIEITNNGAKIEPEVVENLFLPFFTTKKGGKGVGLSISKQIMQLHNGSLQLTSNQVDRVTFSMIFR
ncbi:MAG: ATP-binding protein [Rikenellaceae bacterium]